MVLPSHRVDAVGAPVSDLGPSGYPDSASVVAFSSSSVSGSKCNRTHLTLTSVSLFAGAVAASKIEATNGRGRVIGLEVSGATVFIPSGQTVAVGNWGLVTRGATVGRVTAPLVLRLVHARDSLPAGTRIAVAFAAAPRSHARPKEHASAQKHRRRASAGAKRRSRRRPPPDFPVTFNPFLVGGVLAPVARQNPVIAIAARYLGIPYVWAGARPKTGFDCSGLVKYVYAQLGVTLPHYAAAQWTFPGSVPVPPNRLRPGDLVFFVGSDGTREEPGHVGIYLGDGYLIDAPHTGAFVEVDSLDARWFANNYVGARRIPTLAATQSVGDRRPPAPVDAVGRLFPSVTLGPLGQMGTAAVAPAGAPASRGSVAWLGAVPGGIALALLSGGIVAALFSGGAVALLLGGAVALLLGGAVALRRRPHSPDSATD